jgi:hypothetical protein
MNSIHRPRARAAARPRHWLWLALGALLCVGGVAALRPAGAQEAAAVASASEAELAKLVGPIALYPDDLVAIVLPASTYPLQVVEAARFLEDRKRDPDLSPDEDWDDSIVALVNYPEVVEMLNGDLDWLYDLGTAVLNQRADVLDAIQDFRDEAYAAGNLRSDDRQTVTRADQTIEIKPANPQVIYVPYYEPERVIVHQTIPVYHYYPVRYPVYYYPYPASYVFDTGWFFGVRTWFSLGWHTHHLHVYDWGYAGHPYFGWSYYDPWYVRNVYINVNVPSRHVWEPRYRYGGRPVVRGYEGRVYTRNDAPRVSRGVAGSALRNRSTEGTVRTAPTARSEGGQVGRGVAGSAYRNRSVQATADARARAESARAPAVAPTTRPSPVYRGDAANAATRERVYRSGGGMSQALERNRAIAQPNRAAPSSPPIGRSTGMPREAPRAFQGNAPARSAPAASAAPRGGGSYRSGNAGTGSGGGQRHQPVRGGNGRSAAR